MEKLSAELRLDNEKKLREKDRELEDAKAVIEQRKKAEKDKKKRQRERKERQRAERRRGREELRQQRDRMDAMAKQLDLVYETNRNLMAAGPKKKQQRRRPVVSEEDDDGEDEEEKNEEDPVQQTEEDVKERFKAAAGTKRMVDILKATKKFPANWDRAQPNGGMTRAAIVKYMERFWQRGSTVGELGAEYNYASVEVHGARVPTPMYEEAEMVGEAVLAILGELDGGGTCQVVCGAGQVQCLRLDLSVDKQGCAKGNCSGKNFSVVKAGEYVGSDLRIWLQARASDKELENCGRREARAAGIDVVEGEKAVVLKFEKGVTAVWDVWASEVVKKLVRTPETNAELYRCSLEQLVRIFEAVRADLPWKDRAKARRHVTLAAKKVHKFTLKGVYPLKLPPADAWKSFGVRKVTEEMVKDLHIPKMAENFVKRRTMPVMTSAVKLRNFFCNFKELALLKKRPECLCHMASGDLPRVDGHVCARTTQLRTGPLAVLNKNLKDTPVTKVNFGESMEKAFTEYAVQFSGAASRVQDDAVLQLLPVTLAVDDCRYCMWRTATYTGGVLQQWVELRDEDVKLIFRVRLERFNRLLLRLVVWGEVRDSSTFLDLCEVVAKRMLFWVESVTRDYWITPYPDQDELREVLTLTDEMSATPFDMNVNAAAFFTPYPEDSIFGAGVDTYAHWWFTMGLANPIYTVERITQTLEHALAKYRFKFLAPQSALGYVDKSTALRWKQKVKLEKWRREHGVPEGPVTVDGRAGVVDAGEYCKVLEKYCAGTARLYLDRNAGVGAIICQQRYFDLLVNERVNSAALFEEVTMSPAELVRDLEMKFNRAKLGTVTKFKKTVVFGTTYALLKDKDDELRKYRPVQPNN
ncbi:hypothetical protein CYMTET_46755 [Cymbomonas tetramitiformis]|uniref:Uncharacterized protein n=1 Tax=Cymbomonas tetramitiformis TaxID=36881 RepID=A0AAE0BXC7_9CHLO|nr:hypothetical protein CYMTET_46755 [Cymbomonas tetramitiformis]